ncbi:S1 family peptidase [Kitasatospora sp. NPDC001309]|uniref:S1 family peptidase n=1 Tax=Kitasatospora sp. NPDC001309 TaxID=3364013 RepID=UPI0036B29D78
MKTSTMKALAAVGAALTMALAPAGSASAITGGRAATVQDAPFTVFITGPLPPHPYQCAGTLINSTTVLTAAHCLEYLKGDVIVSSGLSRTSPDQTVRSENIIVHPDYNRDDGENDIGLIKLPSAMKAQPAALPTVDVDNGLVLATTGWGSTVPGGPPSDALQIANFQTVNYSRCGNLDFEFFGLGVFCFGSDTARVCRGDDGDPMAQNGVVHGFVRRRLSGSCTEGAPALATRVFHYVAWIKANS